MLLIAVYYRRCGRNLYTPRSTQYVLTTPIWKRSRGHSLTHRSSIRCGPTEGRGPTSRRVPVWPADTRCIWRTATGRRRFSASPGRVARRPSEGSARATSARYGCVGAPRPCAELLVQSTRLPDCRLQAVVASWCTEIAWPSNRIHIAIASRSHKKNDSRF